MEEYNNIILQGTLFYIKGRERREKLALNGSYRGKAGYTQWLLEKISEGATAAGTERRANQHILGIPFFDFLMNFRLF